MLKSPIKAKEKVVLFLEISHVKIFLSPTYPLKSNVYENIYFLFQKTHTHMHKTFTSKSIHTNASFFPSKKIKDRAFCFSTKKVLVQQFFKCKIYFKNSNKLIFFFFFCGHPGEDFFRHLHFRKQEYYFGLNNILQRC